MSTTPNPSADTAVKTAIRVLVWLAENASDEHVRLHAAQTLLTMHYGPVTR